MLFMRAGCRKPATDQNLPQTSTITIAAIQLPTLKCKTCVNTVKNSLSTVDGIESADIDLPAKKAIVKFITAKLSLEKIRSTISKVGYDADEMKRDSSAYEELPECCK